MRTYNVQSDAYWPFISLRQGDSLIPVVLELKVSGSTLLPTPQSSLEIVLHPHLHVYVHVCACCGIARLLCRLVCDRAGSRYSCVKKGGAAGHEHDVVDVPRVGENYGVQIEEPGFLAVEDGQIGGQEALVAQD